MEDLYNQFFGVPAEDQFGGSSFLDCVLRDLGDHRAPETDPQQAIHPNSNMQGEGFEYLLTEDMEDLLDVGDQVEDQSQQIPEGNAFSSLPAIPFASPSLTSSLAALTVNTGNVEGPSRKRRRHQEVEGEEKEEELSLLSSHVTTPSNLVSESRSSTTSSVAPTFPIGGRGRPESVAQSQLNQVHALQIQQKEQLLQMHQSQRMLMAMKAAEAERVCAVLIAEQQQMIVKIQEELAALRQIYGSQLLDPSELHKHSFLTHDLEVQLKQVELYHRELQSLQQGSCPRCLATLVIINQPFPNLVGKGKTLTEEDLEVRLLCGTATEIKEFSKVKALLMVDSHHMKVGAEEFLDNDEQPLDVTRQTAKFPLKFLEGSRINLVTLKFSMQLRCAQGESLANCTVESEPSNPFVIITHEKQWEGCAGTLLKKEAFAGQLEITWPQFANTLQRHVLKATKQDPIRPTRCLSDYDIRYIKAKFFGNRDIITQKDFDTFWGWFGRNLHILRYQRHIGSLWQQGLIYGFLTRMDVNNTLQDQEPGTFLLRFSERHPGQFAIAYVAADSPNKIKHYLIQKSDTVGNRKTLPDFLHDCPQFCSLLQLTSDPTTGQAIFRKQQKDRCLKPFYSKRASSASPSGTGYDSL